jgi:hypothetical protein
MEPICGITPIEAPPETPYAQSMRAICLLMVCCALACAQTSYSYDMNGRRVESGRLDGRTYTLETVPSLNGRRVPLERVEERVVEQDSSRSVVERTVRRFDQNGNPAQTEKVRIEERKNADGTASTETLTWRADINGRLELAERARAEARPTAAGLRTELTVERPTLNGAFEPLEKRSTIERKTDGRVQQETVTWRPDSNRRFGEVLRQVTERTERDGRTTENTAQYEVGPTGSMEIALQTVSRSVKNPDGSERIEVDLYRNVVPGRPRADEPRLIEQQLVERRPGAAGTTVESVSVRRPAPDGSRPAGAYQKIAERVCAGECK